MSNQQGNGFYDRWLPLFLTRGAGESAQVSERIEHNLKTQVVIPIAKALALGFVAVPLAALGYIGLMWNLLPLLNINVRWQGMMLLGVLCSLVGMLAVQLLQSKKVNPYVRIGIGLVMLVVALIATALAIQERWDWWEATVLILSLGALLGGTTLFYLLFNEMLNPQWPPSPMLLTLREMMREQEPQIKYIERPVLVEAQSKSTLKRAGSSILARLRGEEEDDTIEELDRVVPAPVVEREGTKVVDRDFANMCWFITLAAREGNLSRNHLTNNINPPPTLPFKSIAADGREFTRPLDRKAYNLLFDRAVEEDLVVPGGQRVPPSWVHGDEGQVALGIVVHLWNHLYPGYTFPAYTPGVVNQEPMEGWGGPLPSPTD